MNTNIIQIFVIFVLCSVATNGGKNIDWTRNVWPTNCRRIYIFCFWFAICVGITWRRAKWQDLFWCVKESAQSYSIQMVISFRIVNNIFQNTKLGVCLSNNSYTNSLLFHSSSSSSSIRFTQRTHHYTMCLRSLFSCLCLCLTRSLLHTSSTGQFRAFYCVCVMIETYKTHVR